MSLFNPVEPEVFTVGEVARVAGVATADVHALANAGDLGRPSGFLTLEQAVALVRHLRAVNHVPAHRRRLFAPPPESARRGGVPLAASGALHAAVFAVMVLLTSLGVRSEPTQARVEDPVRLVFLATPGPGGGGGGGGLRQPLPPPKAQLRGESKLKSPVTVARPVERREPEKRVETPPAPAPQPAPTPPVTAPVVSAPSDPVDRPGDLAGTSRTAPSQGPGTGGGTGTGTGTGSGEGNGAGIGDGSIAGIGGGPYRPGSGVTAPGLLREVKPVYSEEGRRRGVEGDVLMEVVVRADGSVGAVRIVRGLGAGLDQRAAEAVRQWKFSPARRFGTPVDVLVEVSVEFRLR